MKKKTIFKIFIALGSLLWALLLGLNNCSPFLRLIFSNTAVNKKTRSLLPRSMIWLWGWWYFDNVDIALHYLKKKWGEVNEIWSPTLVNLLSPSWWCPDDILTLKTLTPHLIPGDWPLSFQDEKQKSKMRRENARLRSSSCCKGNIQIYNHLFLLYNKLLGKGN